MKLVLKTLSAFLFTAALPLTVAADQAKSDPWPFTSAGCFGSYFP
jgi:hypothetical protein